MHITVRRGCTMLYNIKYAMQYAQGFTYSIRGIVYTRTRTPLTEPVSHLEALYVHTTINALIIVIETSGSDVKVIY